MNNYTNLEIAAALQADAIRQARREVNNALLSRDPRLNAIVRFWKSKIERNATRIVNRAKGLGLHSNKFKPNTPEYYSLLGNLVRQAKRGTSHR